MTEKKIEEIGIEILQPSLDLGTDYAEMTLDEFLGEGLLKEVPVVKTLVAFVKTGLAIRERFFIKKFLVFLKELHSGGLSERDLKDFKSQFDSDKDFRNKATEQILILIDRLDSVTKAKISAHLFRAHLENKFDWDRYVALNNCLEDLQEIVYPILKVFSKTGFGNINANPTIGELQRALDPKTGKINFHSQHRDYQALLMSAGIASIQGSYFGITTLGQDLYNYGIAKVL